MNQPDRIKRALNFVSYFCSLSLIFLGMLTACEPTVEPSLRPQGHEKSAETEILETGAAMLQTNSPLNPLNIYLDGFHASKNDPNHQMEAHHFAIRLTKILPNACCSTAIPGRRT